MSIVASDLFAIGWNGQSESDSAAVDMGNRTSTRRFTISAEIASPPQALEVLSSNAGDTTQKIDMRGWSNLGVLDVTGQKTLNGTTSVGIDGSWYRVTRLQVDAVTAGLITLRIAGGGATIATIDSNISYAGLFAQRMFVAAFSSAAGITRYDKMFWVNRHASLTALNPTYRLTADPKTRIRQGVHPTANDTTNITNRVTAPGGVTFVDDNIDQTGSDLPASSDQGLWIEFASTANDPSAPFQDSFTTQITVNSV